MKNYFFCAIALTIMLCFASCEKRGTGILDDTQVPLSQNYLFQDLISSQLQVVNNIINPNELIALANNQNISEEVRLMKVSSNLGFQTIEKFKEHVEINKEIQSQLEKEYSISSYSTEKLTIEIIKTGLILQETKSNAKDGEGCAAEHLNCLAKAGAMAVVLHIGCGAADIIVIVGLLCHGAALAWQQLESNDCNSERRDCQEE